MSVSNRTLNKYSGTSKETLMGIIIVLQNELIVTLRRSEKLPGASNLRMLASSKRKDALLSFTELAQRLVVSLWRGLGCSDTYTSQAR